MFPWTNGRRPPLPSRLERATKDLASAQAGVERAITRCGATWGAWLSATDDRRKALELRSEAERELKKAQEESEINK